MQTAPQRRRFARAAHAAPLTRLGGAPRLQVAVKLGEKKLVTAPAGTVHLLLNVAVRHTAQQGRKR